MSDARGERDGRGAGDVAPGFMDAPERSIREGIRGYLIGLALAAVLTVASFYAVDTHLIWGPGIPMALAVLAVAQIGVHLVFFLHLTTAPDNTNNVLALAFGVLIVALIIAGSLWIMDHLNHRMMPMYQILQIQR
jgi:cytochrome o ubiquinol oxidase subunit IV